MRTRRGVCTTRVLVSNLSWLDSLQRNLRRPCARRRASIELSPCSCSQRLFLEGARMRLDDGIALRVQGHRLDGRLVPCGTGPAPRIALTGLAVELVARREDRGVGAGMTLRWADVADAAVPMRMVVPVQEVSGPRARVVEVGEPAVGELRSVLRRAEQALDVGVVVAHARPRVRRLHPPASTASPARWWPSYLFSPSPVGAAAESLGRQAQPLGAAAGSRLGAGALSIQAITVRCR